MDKRFLSIWHIYNLSTCGIDKKIMSILGMEKDIFVYNAFGKKIIYRIDIFFFAL